MAIKRYLLQSAPCSFVLPTGRSITAPDGVVAVDTDSPEDAAILEHLEGMVSVGNATPLLGQLNVEELPVRLQSVQIDPKTGLPLAKV